MLWRPGAPHALQTTERQANDTNCIHPRVSIAESWTLMSYSAAPPTRQSESGKRGPNRFKAQ